MKIYFKKPNGNIVTYDRSKHKIDSLKERFIECDANGKEIKKTPKKAKKEGTK